MKRSLTVVCTLATVMAVSSALLFAQTAEPPSAPLPAGSEPAAGPSKVAVIAFQGAVMQTNEGQRDLAQLQAKYAPKEASLKTQNDDIEALKKQLQDGGTTLSDADREARLRTIDEKTKNLQREAEDDQNDENSDMTDLYQSLAPKVYAVLETYAQQHGYTLVLDGSAQQNTQSPILWFTQETDITKAVIDAYNTKSGVPAPTTTAAPPKTGATHSSGTTHSTHPSTGAAGPQ
jgi:outer membrane protein